MPTESRLNDDSVFEYRTPFGAKLSYMVFAGLLCFVASIPISKLSAAGTHANAKLPLLVFALFLGVGIGTVAWAAFRTVALSFANSRLITKKRLLFLSTENSARLTRVTLVGQWIGNRNPERVLAVYGKTKSGNKLFVANEQTCDRVDELFDWLASRQGMSGSDLRSKTIGS